MASSPAYTSSFFPRGPSSFHVFINFRGKDTRDGFVSLLYDGLDTAGIHTFLDSEELWGGEEISPSLLRAIRGSKISIPVFSKNYADSKYCLLELSEIWESHLSEGQTILPIFIDVEPRDVRHQTGSFREPFKEHQSKRDSAIVDSWKNALTEVGNLKGWALKGDATIKEQLNIVKSVVQRALREPGSTPLDESKFLVGINSHLEKLFHLLHIGSNDVEFVGICGMGGLGKTTIAEALYNRLFRSFSRCSFLTDVREEASQGNKGLVSLQKRLLRGIFNKEYYISTVPEGKKVIAEKLRRENIFLILDDVDDHEQLDALAGGFNWFGQGSKVIITTRDDHILNVHKKKVGKDFQMYMPEELNFENSLHLFSLHAFSDKEPPEKYKQLSCEVVRYAEGLPLTLEVLGSFLSDKTEEEWEDTLDRLKDILDDKVVENSVRNYDDKVLERLMISYDKLVDPEKTIFLDVACHFNGWRKEVAISVWEACELRPRVAIKVLIQKHLLKIVADGKLKMHDQLRIMGRRIVLRDSCGDLMKRRRLWSQEEIWKVLKKDTGTQVEGILLDTNFECKANDVLRCEDFQKMPNLRFLQFDKIASFNGDFMHLPSTLRWFCWRNTLEILPPNFYHPELVHLDISCNCFNQSWNDPPENKNECFQKLKVLSLCDYMELSVSLNFFLWCPCIQRLNLYACSSLLELPDSICQLASLKTLILSGCPSLKKLPTSIGDLRHLVKLCVEDTNIEELPDGVGQLEKLEELVVSYNSCYGKLVKLPTSMGRMRSLYHFNLEGTRIIKLPDDFSKLSSLEVFRVGVQLDMQTDEGISLESLPSTLTHLQVEDCISLPKIPVLSHLERLEELLLRYCKSLVELPDFSNLIRLRKLDISNCKNLEEIPSLEGTESLEELDASYCDKLTELPDLSMLKRLRKLEISSCENLKKIHGLQGTESLKELDVSYCHKLRELPDLSKLKRLRKLNIRCCEDLDEIQGFEETQSLETLDAQGCYKITETVRKILGQGTLVHNVGELQDINSVADYEIYNGSPILCVVFAFTPLGSKPEKLRASELVTISLEIDAYIHQGEMWTKCLHSIRIEDIKLTYQDIIYIHHFKGFDWFGFPLERKNAIKIRGVRIGEISMYSDSYGETIDWICEGKFVKLLFQNKESDQQMPNQQSSAMLVAEFFRWSHVQENGKISPSHDTEEEEEKRNKTTADLVSCEEFLSGSEVMWAEEEMLRPSKRSHLSLQR